MSGDPAIIDAGEAGCLLYLIGPRRFDLDVMARDLEAALAAGGIGGFLLRADADAVRASETLQPLCRAWEVALFVEGDLDLALEVGADGLHLDAAGDVAGARGRLGGQRILGVACGLGRHAAMVAGEQGADYVAFGDDDRDVDASLLDTVAWWSDVFVLPCLARGRIAPESCPALVAAGADFIAAGDAVWRHPDGPAAGVSAFRDALRRG